MWLIQKEKFMTNKGGRFTPNAIQIHVHTSCGYMHSFRHSNVIGYFRSTVTMQSDLAVWHEERWINLQAGDMLSLFTAVATIFMLIIEQVDNNFTGSTEWGKTQAQHLWHSILNRSTLLSLPPHKSRKLHQRLVGEGGATRIWLV